MQCVEGRASQPRGGQVTHHLRQQVLDKHSELLGLLAASAALHVAAASAARRAGRHARCALGCQSAPAAAHDYKTNICVLLFCLCPQTASQMQSLRLAQAVPRLAVAAPRTAVRSASSLAGSGSFASTVSAPWDLRANAGLQERRQRASKCCRSPAPPLLSGQQRRWLVFLHHSCCSCSHWLPEAVSLTLPSPAPSPLCPARPPPGLPIHFQAQRHLHCLHCHGCSCAGGRVWHRVAVLLGRHEPRCACASPARRVAPHAPARASAYPFAHRPPCPLCAPSPRPQRMYKNTDWSKFAESE